MNSDARALYANQVVAALVSDHGFSATTFAEKQGSFSAEAATRIGVTHPQGMCAFIYFSAIDCRVDCGVRSPTDLALDSGRLAYQPDNWDPKNRLGPDVDTPECLAQRIMLHIFSVYGGH